MNAKTGLAPYVRILGRGPGRSRSLTLEEAQEAMTLILNGDAAPESIGALLMLLRMKGEQPEELAGFARAARATLPPIPMQPALDWPTYAAGRTRGLPWFLLSAKLVARAGYPVLLHGWNSHQNPAASVRNALSVIGVVKAASVAEAGENLRLSNIAYLPLETLSPALFDLLRLRDVLGLRSCVNTLLRVLNPFAADAAVQGVFHPPYRGLQQDVGRILGQKNLTVLKGGGGEFERHPSKEIALFGLRDGVAFDTSAPAQIDQVQRLAEAPSDPSALAALWGGTLQDDFAEAIVLGTATSALKTLGVADARARIQALWDAR